MVRDNGQTPAQRLAKAVKAWSDQRQAGFRRTRKEMLQRFGGPWFALMSDSDRQLSHDGPVNLFYSVASIMIPTLQLRPRAMITPKASLELRPFAHQTEAALDFLAQEDDYDETARKALLEALYGRGIVWTGLGQSDGAMHDAHGYLSDPGRICSKLVREEDFIIDTAAGAMDEITFIGHRYRVPFEWAMESGLYDKAQLEALKNESDRDSAPRGAWQGDSEPACRILDEIELADLWLPHLGTVVTLPGDMSRVSQEFLREDDYFGPEAGPYDVLSFLDMPDTILPIPPLVVVRDLSNVVNDVVAKAADRAKAIKDVFIVKGGNEKEAGTISKAQDLALITGDPDSIKHVALKGELDGLQAATDFFMRLFNQMAGNPDLLGGLAPGADTATQSQMMNNSAQIVVSDKRGRNTRFHRSILRKRAWYLWNGPGPLNIATLMDVPGLEPEPIKWSRDAAEADWTDLRFDVQPYGATDDSPEAQFTRTMTWAERVIIPLAGMATEQGSQLDVAALAEITGRQLNIPEAAAIFRPAPPQQAPAQQLSIDAGETTINQGRPPGPRPVDQAQPEQPVTV